MPSYTGWIDIFCFGTSGYNNNNPYTRDNNLNITSYYGSFRSQYDWGVFNTIYNPATQTTDAPGTWCTLTAYQWDYLLNTRSTSSGIRYAKGTVNGISGLIIVPDNWNTAIYPLDSTDIITATFNSNIISLPNWTTLENNGVVFLPINPLGTTAYWSKTPKTVDPGTNGAIKAAYALMFTATGLRTMWYQDSNVKNRYYVRLVHFVN